MEQEREIKNVLIVGNNPYDRVLLRTACISFNLTSRYLLTEIESVVDMYLDNYVEEQSPRPGLILLDVNKGTQNIWQIITRLRRHTLTTQVPVIAYSQHPSAGVIGESYKSGVEVFVEKPADWVAFVHALLHCRGDWQTLPGIRLVTDNIA